MGLANLRSENIRSTLKRIEDYRLKLAADTSPLVTENHGPPGVFDDGVSIADAAGVSKKKVNAEHLFSYTVLTEAKCCVEIGTNVGISSSYIATAMNAGGPDWQLHTLESSPYRIRLAKGLHQDLGLTNVVYHQGLFYDILPSVLKGLDAPVDLAFIDGQHQYKPTIDFFDMIYAHSAPNALFIFDDIEWSDGMKNAWIEVQKSDRVVMSTAISGVGFMLTRHGNNISAPPATAAVANVWSRLTSLFHGKSKVTQGSSG